MSVKSGQRVLISGAGIAGLTAAYWFAKEGWEVVVLEEADALRKGEFVIDFAGTGWDVAVKMGLEGELKENQSLIHALCFQDGQGEDRVRIEMKDFVESMGVAGKHASINRRHLLEMLYKQVQQDVEFRFSSSIDSLEERVGGVDVVLANGAEESFDLVIGSDGLHSNVRRLVFGEEKQFAKYLGYHVSACRISNVADGIPGNMNLLRLPNKQAGILHLGNGDSLALFVYGKESDEYVPREQRKQVLLDTFGEMGGIVPAILHGIHDQTSLYMDTATQIILPRWHSQRIALIGDAAHCLTLVSGQGASMAMGGAYALAMALTSTDNIEQALALYEARLRPYVEELQRKTQRFAGGFIPSSRFGLWASDVAMGLMRFAWVRNLAAKQFRIQSLFEREENAGISS